MMTASLTTLIDRWLPTQSGIECRDLMRGAYQDPQWAAEHLKLALERLGTDVMCREALLVDIAFLAALVREHVLAGNYGAEFPADQLKRWGITL